jgi:hypothetical protein
MAMRMKSRPLRLRRRVAPGPSLLDARQAERAAWSDCSPAEHLFNIPA